ncbi:hypothetical protein HPP92_021910 [Vanilla planifolia]|uniref:Reverse transcriptase domain-containing protein n=1 Tax=Vanilla planifolia TaxID=51239 RepID=A0A835UEM5_VANPL|nr:hypothetical protein HPP92_021910 [Vanilla planifolia]
MTGRINRKRRFRNAIFKIDIRSAFDRISWGFLDNVLMTFGFGVRFRQLVANSLHSSGLSLLINGMPTGFFCPNCGVKQGDPLSPSLFVLAMDVLSRMINLLRSSGEIDAFSGPRRTHPVSHLAYADDFLIFSTVRLHSTKRLAEVLDLFSRASALQINRGKSHVFHARSTSKSVIRKTERILGFASSSPPFVHLGCGMGVGRRRSERFRPQLDKISNRIASWHSNLLSMGGKKILINSILSSMVSYCTAALNPPRFAG